MRSSSTANLKNDLPSSARQAHYYPGLTYRSLISVGQLCNAGYRVTFDRNGVAVVDPVTNKIGMIGSRDSATRLYHTLMVPNSQPTSTHAAQSLADAIKGHQSNTRSKPHDTNSSRPSTN